MEKRNTNQIGKAMADKMTAKVVSKILAFTLVCIINLNMWSCSKACMGNFEYFFAFR